MKYNKKSIRDIDCRAKKVIVRVDFNVPIKNGVIGNDLRVASALPTINYLLAQGAAVILISHLGRPKGERNLDFSLAPVAVRLSELLGQKVAFAADCVGEKVKALAAALQPGQVLLLENLRFHQEDEANDPAFAAELASLADIFVNDAFGTAHRKHASTFGIAGDLPAVCGLLIENEIAALSRAVEHPERPFVAIVGGAKVSDKILVIDNLLKRVDKLLIGGGMANTFLAAQGCDLQASLVEADKLEWARELLNSEPAKKMALPVDVVAAVGFAADAEHVATAPDSIPSGWMAMDIGPKTRELFAAEVKNAATIVWNGPLGVFEMDAFAMGTLTMAHAVADSSAFSVVGGGDSVAAVYKAGVASRIGHVSTGGGALLGFLEDKPLPGIEALNDKER